MRLKGRTVAAFAGRLPGFRPGGIVHPDAQIPLRWQREMNSATMLTSGSIGNPLTTTDDVIVDGRIITAENHDPASRFAERVVPSVASNRDGSRACIAVARLRAAIVVSSIATPLRASARNQSASGARVGGQQAYARARNRASLRERAH